MSGFHWDWAYAWSTVPLLIDGLWITLLATFLGSILAFVLGLIWTMLRIANIPVVSPITSLIVHFLRGTPFLVQLFFLFYVLPNWGMTLPPLPTGVLGLGLYFSAQASEIYRAGIENIPEAQWEASLVLGLPIRRIWLGIILPQAIHDVLPVLGNIVIAMFKETAVLSSITVFEMLAQAMEVGFIKFRFIEPLTLAGIIFFIISYIAALCVRYLEARDAVGT